MGVEYEIIPSAVTATLSTVESSATAAASHGQSAAVQGHSLAGLCGSAQLVADAVTRLWDQRSDTGVRSGDYASACAAAVSQACATISEGDIAMQQTALAASSQASSLSGFTGQER